ncbi:zinc ABC transporter substrate-binding protein [Paenibacillus mesophilus]|uniref:metal ABC transporter substrate-binding protein n=1 Tax=Paenibacillus mesophilus TaxID=2582849 RepID=UPI00110D3BFF|nr:metal ABC transporter substrate-binding protein [Paenibacillus mesophilus]TMV51428.1 zinc ABC transporter substrate-binding protein [Paenibacillus mesophilus]
MNRVRSKSRFTVLLIVMLVLAAVMTGCGSKSNVTLSEGKVNVVTTFYALYDFAGRIGGDKVNVINLVPAGVEPHDWSPKSRDLTNMSKAQLFVYNGAGFEGWVHDFLDSLNKDSGLSVIEASNGIELIHSEAHEDDHGHDDKKTKDNDKHGHGDEDSDVDPHVWVSPKSALKMAENIKNGIVQADPANKSYYESNYETLKKQLSDLDAKFTQSLSKTTQKQIVVSHQSFGYLCRDYGLTQKPIMGLSPDSEPTAQDLKEINKFVRDNQVKYIFFEELVSDKMVKTLAKDAGVETLVLNPLEGLTQEQVKAGDNYVTVMENNLQNLLKALQ